MKGSFKVMAITALISCLALAMAHFAVGMILP
jgi:hypothetical protein